MELLWRSIKPQTTVTTASADVFSNLKSLVTSCSHWRAVETPVTGTNSLVITPTSASLSGQLYVVLANNVTGASFYQTPDTIASAVGSLQLGIFTGSGSFGGINSDNPFSGSATAGSRWSKYWYLSPITTLSQSFILESPESIFIGSRHTGGGAITHGAFAGAIIESFTSGTGEAGRRLYGIVTTGLTSITSNFWTVTNAFGSHITTANQTHAGLWPVTASMPQSNFVSILDDAVGTFVANTTVISHGSQTARVGLKNLFSTAGSSVAVGWMRGVFKTGDLRSLEVITSGGLDVAICLGADTGTAGDAMLLPLSGGGLSMVSPYA